MNLACWRCFHPFKPSLINFFLLNYYLEEGASSSYQGTSGKLVEPNLGQFLIFKDKLYL